MIIDVTRTRRGTPGSRAEGCVASNRIGSGSIPINRAIGIRILAWYIPPRPWQLASALERETRSPLLRIPRPRCPRIKKVNAWATRWIWNARLTSWRGWKSLCNFWHIRNQNCGKLHRGLEVAVSRYIKRTSRVCNLSPVYAYVTVSRTSWYLNSVLRQTVKCNY